MTDIGTWYWHVHHDRLCEPLTEPLRNRIDYINSHKLKAERAIRLHWMAPVQGDVPAAYVKALAAYDKALAAYVKARAASVKALAAYVKARAAYDKAWPAYDKAWPAYDKAWDAYVKARDAYVKARAAYVKAWDAALPALEALHAVEHPGCPWDGTTIFPVAK